MNGSIKIGLTEKLSCVVSLPPAGEDAEGPMMHKKGLEAEPSLFTTEKTPMVLPYVTRW